MIHNEARFDQLIADARAQSFSGWDFSYLDGRKTVEELPWDYAEEVRQAMQTANSLLDMGTGGGEFLASLAPLPKDTHATEGWALNVPIAQKRLEPHGVTVHAIDDKDNLPFDDSSFDLIINRHEALDADDIYRMLKPNGTFIMQAVGGKNNIRLNELLSAQSPEFDYVLLEPAIKQLEAAGLDITYSEEYFPEERYFDIGAVVFYLEVIKWQIEDFSVEKYRQELGEIHNMIERDGYLSTSAHSFIIKAHKDVS